MLCSAIWAVGGGWSGVGGKWVKHDGLSGVDLADEREEEQEVEVDPDLEVDGGGGGVGDRLKMTFS